LLEQVDVLSKLDKGLNIGVVRHHYDINILMIHLIQENECKGSSNRGGSVQHALTRSLASLALKPVLYLV
jgi:hypothetical protein